MKSARRTSRKRARLTDDDYTRILLCMLVESVVIDNDASAKQLLFSWQPKETADEAISSFRAMTPCRLLMAGGAS